MMADYISREAAKAILHKKAMETALNNAGYQCDAGVVFQDASHRLKVWLDDVPAADVKPVIHASWERIEKYDPESNVICSNCKEEFSYIDGLGNLVIGYDLPRFCPACGAMMI